MRCWALLWTMLFLLQVHAASMSMGSAGPSHQSHSDEGLISANRRLGLLCRKKRLGAARQIFKDLVVEQITPDVRTYTAFINTLARCGSLKEASATFKDMSTKGVKPNAATYCALIRGFCEAGFVREAANVEEEMTRDLGKGNSRVVRTIIRGCVRIGDLNLAESVLDKGDLKYLQDPYIVEALVSLMCQNLRLDEASRCVKASCRDVKNAAEGRLAYAKACLKVAMAGAFLGEGDISRKWIKRALQLRDTPSSDGIVSDGQDTLQQRKARRRPGDDSAKKLKIVQWQSFDEAISYLQNFLARWSLTSVQKPAARRKKVLGLVLKAFARLLLLRQDSETSSAAIGDTAQSGHGKEEETCSSILRKLFMKCGVGKIIQLIGEAKEEAALAQSMHDAVRRDGTLRWRHLHPSWKSKKNCEVILEIGSGTGDWAISQSLAESSDRLLWVCVEQRMDRLWMSWAGAVLRGAESKMVFVWDDADSFLRKRVRNSSVSHILVRYPQPPITAPHGESWDRQLLEGQHMLTVHFFSQACQALELGGNVTVITDNVEYARLIADNAAASAKLASTDEDGQRCSLRSQALSARHASDPQAPKSSAAAVMKLHAGSEKEVVILETRSGVHISRFRGGGSKGSWFEALWMQGGHWSKFCIVMRKVRMDGDRNMEVTPVKNSVRTLGAFYD